MFHAFEFRFRFLVGVMVTNKVYKDWKFVRNIKIAIPALVINI